jgi:hypothetical protein
MTAPSRRHILRGLGAFSAVTALDPALFGLKDREGAATACTTPSPSSTDLYLIFTGPWLFVMKNASSILAVTSNFTGHSYSHFDPLGAGAPSTLAPDTPYAVQIQGSTSSTEDAAVCSMRASYQGMIYNNFVTYAGRASGLQTITIPMPTWIEAAALMQTSYFSLSVDPKSLQNAAGSAATATVKEWPSALLFTYSGWKSMNFGIDPTSPIVSRQNQGQPTHYEFKVNPPPPPATPACSDYNMAAMHAEAYFSDLMSLLSFQGAATPAVSLPRCSGTAVLSPIPARRGDDSNVSCKEIGLNDSCTNVYPARKPQHLYMMMNLVNCASGGGGILGCC